MTGKLLGFIKVNEASSNRDECSDKSNSYALNRAGQVHLFLALRLGMRHEILFEVFNLPFKEGNGVFDRLRALGIKERKYLHRAFEVLVAMSCFLSWQMTERFCFKVRLALLRGLYGAGHILSP